MNLDAPLFFEPLYMERVWGGRHLQSLFGRKLPVGAPIGESWEVVDREEAQSVVREGKFRGLTLHDLWKGHREAVFGADYLAHPSPTFPLLFKLLDARERLSVQVHPPAAMAPLLGGEPKTEMWYIVDAELDHAVFAGLEKGMTREVFESHLAAGTVDQAICSLTVKAGDAIFIPSGRIHAIGAGNVIVEVQQNSDTTYRVFDWNRLGLDGKPRTLHIQESLQSIDFTDTEPRLAVPDGETVVVCAYFRIEKWLLGDARAAVTDGRFAIFTVLSGIVGCAGQTFHAGDFFLVPACLEVNKLTPLAEKTSLLRTTIPCQGDAD